MAQLSKDLQRYFFEESPGDPLTLANVLRLAGERTFGFLFVLLALPSALPVPAAGYALPFGLVLFLLAVQLLIGSKSPWLPGWIINRPIALSRLQAFVKHGIPWIRRIEGLTKPRLTPLCSSGPGRALISCAVALMALFMMVPVPGTNTLPAIGIFVTGLGLLHDDGAISLVGLAMCLIAAIFSVSILYGLFMGGTLLFSLNGQP
ncbi:MAG: exopolysaccharide biosynthesis protein [Methylomicrobium sp.]|nr:exopolysaccharide biosynthesis protein [Methylomicrobium sp.]